MSKPRTKKTNPFEKSLSELTQLIEKMESGKCDLATSLQYFEQGVALIRTCQEALKDAEQQVTVMG